MDGVEPPCGHRTFPRKQAVSEQYRGKSAGRVLINAVSGN
jgi:hypothetical protein